MCFGTARGRPRAVTSGDRLSGKAALAQPKLRLHAHMGALPTVVCVTQSLHENATRSTNGGAGSKGQIKDFQIRTFISS